MQWVMLEQSWFTEFLVHCSNLNGCHLTPGSWGGTIGYTGDAAVERSPLAGGA